MQTNTLQLWLFLLRQGEEWYKYRKILIQKMLPLPEILQYVDSMDQVGTDFMTRLRDLQSESRDGVISRLEHEVFKWALECTKNINLSQA